MFGCRICSAARSSQINKIRDGFANFRVKNLKMSNVKKHMNSKMHQRCLAAVSSAGPNPNSPTPEQFEQVWSMRKMGASFAIPIDGLTSGDDQTHRPSDKLRRMHWCLAEAKRVQFRNVLRTAASATLNQDARQEMLLVRMTACDADLNQKSGLVGMVKTAGGATNLCIATVTALEQLCTPFAHEPAAVGSSAGDAAVSKPAELDTELMKHVCSIVNWWYTDAASDELSAGEMLMSGATARRLFPNLKICGREKAHASRRVLERPQKAEPFLDDVAAHVLWNYDSIASILQHMPMCSSVFQAGSRENEDAELIKVLRFRRHRFDSQAEPFARIVLSFDAVLKASEVISHARKGDDAGKHAAKFLGWLNDEKALQLAMLADASDQILTLVRKVDVDFPDPSEHAKFVAAFILEGTRMWLEDKCWAIGCTEVMMRFLKKKRNYLISGGVAGTLTLGGGVDDACKDRCMQRMKCWFRLALEVCRAEFPHFEAINAFRIFELSGGDIALHGDGDEDCPFLEPLQRLSAIFGCDPGIAFAQYRRHLPLARSEKLAQSSHTNLSAWQAAIQRTQQHMKHSKASSALWGSDTIRKLLVFFGSCCPGTSPIERMFSRMEKQWGARLNNSAVGTVLDTMELYDLTENNKDLIMKMACELWSLRFPPTRSVPAKRRIHRGIAQPRKSAGREAFGRRVKQQRQSLHLLPGANIGEAGSLAASQTEAVWTPKLEKERTFNAKKVVRSKAELFLQGGALPSEHRQFAVIAKAHKEQRAKAIGQRKQSDKRKAAAMAPTLSITLRGKPVYIDESALPVAPSEIATVVMKNRMTFVEAIIQAHGGVIIVDDPGKLHRRAHWVVILTGASAVNKEYFASAAAHGSCMSWLPAVAIRRFIWLSIDADAAEPMLAQLIRWACRLPASKWQLQVDWDEDTYLAKQRKVSNLLGVVTAAEKADAKFAGQKKTLLYDDFLAYVQKFDPSVSGFKSEVGARSSHG